MSTLDDFQKRISKLEAEVADIKKAIEKLAETFSALAGAMSKPTLVEASDYVEPMPEERIAEEAVEEAHVASEEE